MSIEAILRPVADLARAGRIEEARAALDAALKTRDDDVLLSMAAMLATRAGDAHAAADHLEVLHARQPEDRATRINLARTLIEMGRYDRIAALLAPLPQEPRTDRLAAFAALRTGDVEAAIALYRRVLSAWPTDADSWANLGQAELAGGTADAAIGALERAITLERTNVGFYLALVHVLDVLDRPVERRTVARDAARIAADDAAVQLALGLAEAAVDDAQAAEQALRRAVLLAPDDPAAYLELGLLLENRNDLEALDALIATARAHVGGELALLEGWSAYRRGEIARADALVRTIPGSVSERRRAHLDGLVADRLNDTPRAFDAFSRMNAAALAEAGPPPERSYRRDVEIKIRASAGAAASDRTAPDRDEPTPAFIIGFPRSGTTLLDTFLSGLPQTYVLEERPMMETIERRIGDPSKLAATGASDIAAFRRDYRQMVEAIVPERPWRQVIDKHPLHMTRVAVIDMLFPGAPIILVERHPYDVVLSCFMANFHLNHAMRSFTDLEEAARTYDAVFSCWSEAEERLRPKVHRVRYERLVADPEAELRAATDFLGQAFTPDLLDHVGLSAARGPVRTASYAQVTQPLYQRAVARWHRYRDQLAPVMPILRPWVDRMGYDA